tara:strand:- start:520 stop:738 length:219 start_codon:yes stop_codon:yes gene_type:complete
MQIRAKSSPLVKALAKKLEGDIAIAQANIDVFLEQSVGVGEHSDVVKAIETNVEALASADEKLQILKKLYGV